MRKKDYKNHLDKISCSNEFSKKMEDLLTAEPDGKYDESLCEVYKVDVVEKRNYKRVFALAASFALIIGVSGVTIKAIKNNSDFYENSDSSIPETTELADSVPEVTEPVVDAENNKSQTDFSDMSVVIDFNGGSYSQKYGNITVSAYDEIIEILKSTEWEAVNSDEQEINADEAYNAISLFVSTENENYTCTIKNDEKGTVSVIKNDEEKLYYTDSTTFYKVKAAIAKSVPYLDWNIMGIDDSVAEIMTIYRDEIVYKSTQKTTDDIRNIFWKDELFAIGVDKNILSVSYTDENGEQYVIYFETPTENTINPSEDNQNKEPVSGTLNSKLNDLINIPGFADGGSVLYYSTGHGQFSKGYDIGKIGDVGGVEFLNILMDYEWTPCDEHEYIKGETISFSYYMGEFDLNGINYAISRNGEVYDYVDSILYRAENQDITALQEKFDNLCQYGNEGYISYLLCSRADNFTTLEGDVSIYYNPLDETGEKKPVNCTGKMYMKNEVYADSKDVSSELYYNLNGIDSDYSGEIYKQGHYWAFVEKGDSIAKSFYHGDVDREFDSYKVFERDNYTASGGYDNFDALNIDYDNLCDDVFYTFTRKNDDFMNVLDYQLNIAQNEGCVMEYIYNVENRESNNDYSEILEFRVDENGTLIYYKRARKNLATGEVETSLEFKLTGSSEQDIDYDNPDFKFPELSEDLKKEFELIDES